MTQLNLRQQNILDIIGSKKETTNQDILAFLQNKGEIISRETLVRDLNILIQDNLILKTGRGRGVVYKVKKDYSLLRPIDVNDYFSRDVDIRSPKAIQFNFDIFDKMEGFFSENELAELETKNKEYCDRVAKLPPSILQKELERITIELSWKSSKIEGNTYTLLDTEILIKENKEAEGHDKKEAVMILNHKKALDYILENREKFKDISLRVIENVHRILVENLDVNHGIREKAVGITGTAYRPLDNKHQIVEVMEKATALMNNSKNAWDKALLSLILIAYIQPFEDGNKRTSRLLANASLLAYDICPISFRSIDETEYKKAVILFYELGNASLMKKLFLEQWNFAVQNYFR